MKIVNSCPEIHILKKIKKNFKKVLTKQKCSVIMYKSVAREHDMRRVCGCSSMVESQPSKLVAWVRFPSPAPYAPVAQVDRATAF